MTSALEVRQNARRGVLKSQTSGLAPNHIQANLIVLPASVADDFELLCARNPVQCPLLGRSVEAGNPYKFTPSALFTDSVTSSNPVIDITTDLPAYNIYEHGKLIGNKTDIKEEWTSCSVAFLIGCSFSFESALAKTNLPVRQWETNGNVSMYRTNVRLNPAGVFTTGCQIVSMRPYLPEHIEKVRDVTRPFVKTHGEPIDWGWEAVKRLGISDISKPDFGDSVPFKNGEVPVFWGCGVTPQAAVVAAGEKIPGKVMAHKPGHMLVLDITEEELFQSEKITA